MQEFDVICGVDVGKGFHHLYALSKDGRLLINKPLPQCEHTLVEAFSSLLSEGSVLVVVDQPNNIGSLTVICARKAGCHVSYLPGLAMRRAAGILPGDAKTDAIDAYVICMTSKCLPQSLRVLPPADELRAGLSALIAHDDDCRCDLNREINRLRAHLVECHPAFERALGGNVKSPFVLRLLQKYGGPWAIRKAGRGKVMKWAGTQKRVPRELLARLLDAIWEMTEAPPGAALREEVVLPAIARRIGELVKARDVVECRLEEMLCCEPLFLALKSMPGVGTKTAVAFIVHVNISDFPSVDRLASYAGLAPRTCQSGSSIKGESASKIGNRALKNALFLSAFASLRSDPLAKEYYDKKRAEGKSHNASIICLARRRLKVMYAIARDLRPFRPAA